MVSESVEASVLPNISESAWGKVRAQFARSLPAVVSTHYLGTVLNQKENSAAIVLRNLRTLGLVDAEGRPTERAVDWRDDTHYAAACAAMLEDVYPAELRDIAPPPDPDREKVRQWLMRTRRVGAGAAGNLAATYSMIAKAELPSEKKVAQAATNGGKKPAAASEKRKPAAAATAKVKERENGRGGNGALALPTPQIAVQVNISPEMTSEQIEAVFASMAKHLYQITD